MFPQVKSVIETKTKAVLDSSTEEIVCSDFIAQSLDSRVECQSRESGISIKLEWVRVLLDCISTRVQDNDVTGEHLHCRYKELLNCLTLSSELKKQIHQAALKVIEGDQCVKVMLKNFNKRLNAVKLQYIRNYNYEM
jgi:hypothetical protein